jgi:hypothetical protein
MTVGLKYKFWIPSDLALGPRGRPPVIPPNSLLVFEIELLDVVPAEGKAKSDEEEDEDLDLKVKKKVGKSWCRGEFAGSPGEQLPCTVPLAARWSCSSARNSSPSFGRIAFSPGAARGDQRRSRFHGWRASRIDPIGQSTAVGSGAGSRPVKSRRAHPGCPPEPSCPAERIEVARFRFVARLSSRRREAQRKQAGVDCPPGLSGDPMNRLSRPSGESTPASHSPNHDSRQGHTRKNHG